MCGSHLICVGAQCQGTKIDWKSDDMNLCKKHPREGLDSANAGDEDWEGDVGTFFWFFQEEGDQIQVGPRSRLHGRRS